MWTTNKVRFLFWTRGILLFYGSTLFIHSLSIVNVDVLACAVFNCMAKMFRILIAGSRKVTWPLGRASLKVITLRNHALVNFLYFISFMPERDDCYTDFLGTLIILVIMIFYRHWEQTRIDFKAQNSSSIKHTIHPMALFKNVINCIFFILSKFIFVFYSLIVHI